MTTQANESRQTSVLLLDDNLMSSMRIQSQLKRLGCQVETMRTLPNEPQSTLMADLVLINLGSRSLNGIELIGACRSRFGMAKIVGFCGHLEIEIRRAAKAAGIHRLLTNEQAFGELEKLLQS